MKKLYTDPISDQVSQQTKLRRKLTMNEHLQARFQAARCCLFSAASPPMQVKIKGNPAGKGTGAGA